MYTPPGEEGFPEPPAGPSNPSDPYTPGPGPIYTYPQPGKGDVFFNQDYWTPLDANITWIAGHWHCVFPYAGPNTGLFANGSWFINYRPSYIHIVWSGGGSQDINFQLMDFSVEGGDLAHCNNCEKDFYLPISFEADDIRGFGIEQTDPERNPININLIEFL
ncbi:MAG: hypothetical protein JRI34_02745 [Deltaproteobacteria bacterium]|nr:hypothetical protein [Deltaproteobacteria bacterium]